MTVMRASVAKPAVAGLRRNHECQVVLGKVVLGKVVQLGSGGGREFTTHNYEGARRIIDAITVRVSGQGTFCMLKQTVGVRKPAQVSK